MEGEGTNLKEFLAKYGERGYYVLKSLLDASKTYKKAKLGDFDLRDVKDFLIKYGLDYNPVPLLAKLEKEYEIIRTTYKSGSQHWWNIIDKQSLEDALYSYDGTSTNNEDPKLKLLKIQFYSLDPERILNILEKMSKRKKITEDEKKELRKIAFNDLPRIVEFLTKAKSEYEDELISEIDIAEKIIDIAEGLIIGSNKSSVKKNVFKEIEFENEG
ncbi:hypothetical protein Calag_1332 [Caldisphaera lagunensis DSM 15908]|uniref:Uncharacterized protein n=1 Tax=Caldisphaera lagunensis (strain DSM 15908 / JCM 11604 / ANMR 0165 / IC-154) TaxID=1056495 RepID=L0AAY5_CALLD|nr:hypothetical protein [Caldisphaera lagunensis]AFZ71041.1 hypothetical protein Calag_1332 [Caldisphaera lagunensis DSM 15908]